jgi:hypothetical protein
MLFKGVPATGGVVSARVLAEVMVTSDRESVQIRARADGRDVWEVSMTSE